MGLASAWNISSRKQLTLPLRILEAAMATSRSSMTIAGDKLFHLIVGTVFALAALLQALRIYLGWPVVIGGWNAPMWVSWIAVVVAGILSYFALTLKSHK
jgi:hypothetical protein